MRNCPLPINSTPGFFTALVVGDHIEMLCRSADWYALSPIQRYLYNMAASVIRMEDAKTETRIYTFERYDQLRGLVESCTVNEFDAAYKAWEMWYTNDLRFGVVHLEQEAGKRGDLITGDDPTDICHFGEVDGSLRPFLDRLAETLLEKECGV